MMGDDMTLVQEFAATQSEPAFAALVERHLGLVHSAALRQVGDAHLAEEITQAVFIILARKAAALGPKTVLSAWLYRTTRYAAADTLKARRRRQAREQEAHMQSTLNEPDPDAWAQLAPLLDDVLAELGETDRTALVLRYFENKTAREIAGALRMEEGAAQKRVARALEKLRARFVKRGVALTATVIAGAVAANSVQAAPVGLAVTVTGLVAKGTSISGAIATLVKGTMKTMTWLKLKFAAGVGVAALLAGGAATVAVSQSGGAGGKLSREEIFQKSEAAYAAMTSYSDDGKSVSTLNGKTITHTFSIKLGRPNLYRVEWEESSESAGYRSTREKQVLWSEGKGDFLEMLSKVRKESNKESAFSTAAGISGRASATIPGTFFAVNSLNELGGSIASAKQKADAKVGDVDCYVFTSEANGRAKTVWIGKHDFLIHQIRIVTSAETMKAIMAEATKRRPEIVARMPKSGYSDSTSTETHEHIVVNKKFSPSDFSR